MNWQQLRESLHDLLHGREVERVTDLGLITLFFALLASLAAGLVLSWCYSRFYGSRATGSNVHRAFPLIAIATTAIFICVQFSLPLSLGLLGALSVIRFRTPIKEPEEIGFLMLVVAAGLCSATFNTIFLLLILGTALIAFFLLRWSPAFLAPRAGHGTVVVRCPGEEFRAAEAAVGGLLPAHLTKPVFESLSTEGDHYVLTWSFRKADPGQAARLEEALRRELPSAEIGLFFSQWANT